MTTGRSAAMKIYSMKRKTMVKLYLGSLVRHAMTAVAGALIGLGVLSAQNQDKFVDANSEVVSGLALFAVGQGLSLLGKKKDNKKG